MQQNFPGYNIVFTMPKETIAIVEDEEDIAGLIEIHLVKAGYTVSKFASGNDFVESLETDKPDLVLLDLMLPDLDGLEVCKRMKQNEELSTIPIIMVTSRAEETDKIVGLELGADDYIVKPFSPKELVTRVRVALRRGKVTVASGKEMEIGGVLKIDPRKFEVRVSGKKIELTTTEFRILKALAAKPGWVFSRDKLLDMLWGDEKSVIDRTIDVHIKNLREKLGKAGDLIRNIRGVGYKIEE